MGLNRPRPRSRATFVSNKHWDNLIRKAEREMNEESSRQIDIMYHAAGIALNRLEGWKKLRLERFWAISNETFNECATSLNLSMIQMCSDELNIDLTRDIDLDWHKIKYLNSELDNRETLSAPEWLYMRQQQKLWIATQIEASLLIALHRKEGWGAERCGRFHMNIEDVKWEYDCDPKRLKEACKELTGFVLLEDWELTKESAEYIRKETRGELR